MVLMIHLSVELVNEVSSWNKTLKTSLLAIALLQVYYMSKAINYLHVYTSIIHVCIIIILILHLSVRACVTYEQEVTRSHLTQAKKFFFLSIAGLGHYNRQPIYS